MLRCQFRLRFTAFPIRELYKNQFVWLFVIKVRPSDEDTNFFDIVVGVLQGVTLAPYLFINYPRLRASNVGRFNEKKMALRWQRQEAGVNPHERLRWGHSASGKYTAQAESLLQSLEQAAGGISLCVNADKTEFMCFNQTGGISNLNGRSLKLVDKFTYLRNSVSSTENYINSWLAKAWTAIDRLSVIWKLDLSEKNKAQFFPSNVNIAAWMYHTDADKAYGEKAWWQLHKNAASCIEQVLGAVSHKAESVQTPTTISKNIQIRLTRYAAHCWRSRDELISHVLSWKPSHRGSRVGWLARAYL